jgi:hypothetical protein
MLSDLISTRTIRFAVFAVSTVMLTAMVSVPAAAKDKVVSKSEIKKLISNAETKVEHERIAQYFEVRATEYEAEAKEHGGMALLYQHNTAATPTKYPGSMQTFQHCDSMSKSLQQAAGEARKLAAEHREMANEAKI